MSTTDTNFPATEQSEPEKYDWAMAFRVLHDLLFSNNGCVSSTKLRRELESHHGVHDARPLVVELQYFDPESSRDRGIPVPDFRFTYFLRSFYSQERYEQVRKEQEAETTKEADDAGLKASVEDFEEPTIARTNKQDEARLVTYVRSSLEKLYADISEERTEEEGDAKTCVYDVHNARPGSSFENVDLIVVHWRPRDVCELVTVEVKLELNAQVVQQALNYKRFCHRAWIAVVVQTDEHSELRARYPTLFEYAVSQGLGILACRRRQGGRYDVFPIHWPLRSQPDPLEREEFLERYRDEFEEAGVIESRAKRRFPRLW